MGDAIFTRRFSLNIFNPIVATGGTITDIGDYRYHAFTSVGTSTFTITDEGTAKAVDVLVVAGGGGGGTNNAGGGGAGGLIWRPELPISTQNYTVTIGAGGVGSSSGNGGSGQNSVFGSLLALGGGGGSTITQTPSRINGGSGGGIGAYTSTFVNPADGLQPSQPGDSGAFGYGNSGGAGGRLISGDPEASGGAGGGAFAAGGNGITHDASSTAKFGPDGGAGLNLSQFFPNWGTNASNTTTSTRGYFAGGGGGASGGQGQGGFGGVGGGGAGSPAGATAAAFNAIQNTGGGGGGADNAKGGNGGSGIVVVRYRIR